jgi:hypothetical protein
VQAYQDSYVNNCLKVALALIASTWQRHRPTTQCQQTALAALEASHIYLHLGIESTVPCFLVGTRKGGLPQADHTQRNQANRLRVGPKAKPHPRDTPNTAIPGGAQCLDQNSLGVEPTHLLGVLQRLPAQRNHANLTSIHWPRQ